MEAAPTISRSHGWRTSGSRAKVERNTAVGSAAQAVVDVERAEEPVVVLLAGVDRERHPRHRHGQ
ncbi:hypothetical protein ACH4OY_17480 [Micromonospora rubida]|uniref:Uncharacterized protein n=1 Tax=Micromonospora rubida TaxID=2697657 RepID=A0ABW7SNG3_9ACTN